MKAWRAAGYDVQRLPTPAVYAEPERLLAMVPGAERRSYPLLRGEDRRSAPPAGYGTSACAASRIRSRPSCR